MGRQTNGRRKVCDISHAVTPLTRRQFKLSLLENGLLDTVEQMIGAIEDPALKSRIQIEYSESERFERTNDSVKYMLGTQLEFGSSGRHVALCDDAVISAQ
ncbi:hypothetical protein LZ086_00020 [Acinetobacter johnsonii]|nr:hypothetical protein LZ086_00020 [Acinetobacter johnsonii]